MLFRSYVVTLEYTGDASNYVSFSRDATTLAHGGNACTLVTGSWSALSAQDYIFYVYTAPPSLSKLSGTDSGFANTVTGGDTDPFNSGEKVSFTVQAGDSLADGTYYWRSRCKDPNGSNTYSSWSTTRSFTVSTTSISKVSGVSYSSISKILSVSKASISKISGLS